MLLAARRFSKNAFTLAITKMIASLIVAWEPHSVPAVDNTMEMVVRIVRLIMGLLTTEFDEANESERTNGTDSVPLDGMLD